MRWIDEGEVIGDGQGGANDERLAIEWKEGEVNGNLFPEVVANTILKQMNHASVRDQRYNQYSYRKAVHNSNFDTTTRPIGPTCYSRVTERRRWRYLDFSGAVLRRKSTELLKFGRKKEDSKEAAENLTQRIIFDQFTINGVHILRRNT